MRQQRLRCNPASNGSFAGSRSAWSALLLLIALACPGVSSPGWAPRAGPDDGRRAYTLETVASFGAPLNLSVVSMPLIDNAGNVLFFASGDPLDASGALLTTASEAHLYGNGSVSFGTFDNGENKRRSVLSRLTWGPRHT